MHSGYEVLQVHIIHAACALQNPINLTGFIDLICHAAFNEVIAIYVLTDANKLALMYIVGVNRNNRKAGVIGADFLFNAACLRFFDGVNVAAFFLEHFYIFVFFLDIFGVTIKLIKGKTLLFINRAISNASTKKAVFVIVKRHKTRLSCGVNKGKNLNVV